MSTTENKLRAAQVFIMVISLVFNIYLYVQKEQYRITSDMASSEIIRLTERLFNLQAQIGVHQDNIAAYQQDIDSLMAWQRSIRRQSELHYQQAMIYKHEVDKLKQQLNETPTVIDLDDDEHLRLFRKWTTGQ
jgi:hypothetical protein